MPFVKTDDGQEIYYQVQGVSGPLLICISGYFGISDLWKPLIANLGSSYRCLTFDSRGYGRSSKPEAPEAYSVVRSSEDVATVINAAGLADEACVLVTHSMGGNIASAYTLAHPKNVTGIIYTATYYDGINISKFLPMSALYDGADIPSKCVEFYTNMRCPEDIAHEAAKWPAYIRKNNAKALYGFEMNGRYSQITVPTVIIQGEEDFAGPIDIAVKPMLAELPSCTLKPLPGVCHFPPVEAPAEVKRVIEEFLAGQK
ncbi:putative alpha/beta fold family hydrolase [Aspergillus pseudocaelatus]|uniref:Alpha/beta fold family hydrolase n=1 Tax=Aspergillus pseudocaelatus TaxID=1825620 RepID=A0ABQ6W178_9EURO|nr:putative alpha/beta fold family hydrolase [Aspergillus pseudocaelatus]